MSLPQQSEVVSLGALYDVISKHAEGIKHKVNREESIRVLIENVNRQSFELTSSYKELKRFIIYNDEITLDKVNSRTRALKRCAAEMPADLNKIDKIYMLAEEDIGKDIFNEIRVHHRDIADINNAELDSFERLNEIANSLSNFSREAQRAFDAIEAGIAKDDAESARVAGRRKGIMATLAASLMMAAFFFYHFAMYA